MEKRSRTGDTNRYLELDLVKCPSTNNYGNWVGRWWQLNRSPNTFAILTSPQGEWVLWMSHAIPHLLKLGRQRLGNLLGRLRCFCPILSILSRCTMTLEPRICSWACTATCLTEDFLLACKQEPPSTCQSPAVIILPLHDFKGPHCNRWSADQTEQASLKFVCRWQFGFRPCLQTDIFPLKTGKLTARPLKLH